MSEPPFPSSEPAPPAAEPEYLHGAGAARRPGGRQRLMLTAAVLGVAAVGAGGWATAQFLGSGAAPASAVPATAVGYVSLDLDPSASQKIEALRMLKKFPALAEELDLDVRDDVRRWVFEQLREDTGCALDYDRDVEPWLGDRVALAAVPDDDAPVAPLVVVQVRDRDAAGAGVTALEECANAGAGSEGGDGGAVSAGEPVGVAFVGDYMLVTEEADDADAFARAAEAAPLADDPDFTSWMAQVGDAGIVTMYAAADAPRLMMDAAAEGSDRALLEDGAPDDAMGQLPLPFAGVDERMRTLWKDFAGMAAVVRFADGSMEAEVVGSGMPSGMAVAERTGPSLAELPDGTAAAFSVSLPAGWSKPYTDALVGMFSAGESADEFWAEGETATGLELPEDIEKLFGDGFALSLDASADLEALTESSAVPQVPVGLLIAGDPTEIRSVVDKLLGLAGPDAEAVSVETGDGLVAVGLDPGYVAELVAGGSLGERDSFARVVPEADRAGAGLFVDFDAGGGWLESLVADDPEARANVAPLDALGASTWTDGEVQRGLFRFSTDE